MSAASNSPALPESPIRVGVSSCLLGQEVRFDAGHKRESFVADVLSRYFELLPVCPEVAIGLGVPRQPIHLVGEAEAPRAIGVKTPELDVTERLAAYGQQMAARLGGISGYIFKSKSPSCGLFRVKVYGPNGYASKNGTGIYAREIAKALPLVPLEEEGRLNDPALRENFIERIYAFRRWQELLAGGLTVEKLVEFHAAHKLILMAHGRGPLKELGQFVAEAGKRPLDALAARYGEVFMAALAHRVTRRRHTGVLFHLMGYLKKAIGAGDNAELVEVIDDYRTGKLPLIVPVTLLKHHFRVHPHPYINKQLYLSWAPASLGLWNAI
jgi:uncharacterized protein YbgA (DUF1722 family)/uncharacterized protein YbbK (DUF523 family)